MNRIQLVTSLFLQEVNHHIQVNEFGTLARDSAQLQRLKIDMLPSAHNLLGFDETLLPDVAILWITLRERCIGDLGLNRVGVATALASIMVLLPTEEPTAAAAVA
jgi:hypothetical protein